MKAMTKELKETIDATLERWQNGTDSCGDGFNIIRWARKGWLVRKPDEMED